MVNLAEKSEEVKEPEVVKIDLVSSLDILTQCIYLYILYIRYLYQEDHIFKKIFVVVQYVTNQKLGLCEALLSLGVWDRAKEILDKLPEFFGTVHKPIATGLCAMVHCMMDTLYKK